MSPRMDNPWFMNNGNPEIVDISIYTYEIISVMLLGCMTYEVYLAV
jgi:hypothetical protein